MSFFNSSSYNKLEDSKLSTLKIIHATTLREISNLEEEILYLNNEILDKKHEYDVTSRHLNDPRDGYVPPHIIERELGIIQEIIDTIYRKRDSQTSKLNRSRERLQEVERLISEEEKEKGSETRFLNTALKNDLNKSIGVDNTKEVCSSFNNGNISLGDKYPYKKRKC